MKPEEAIKILQERIGLTKKVWSNVPEIIEYREALESAVKALEKQTPMKPNNARTIFDFSGRYYTKKVTVQFATVRDFIKQIFIAISADRN